MRTNTGIAHHAARASSSGDTPTFAFAGVGLRKLLVPISRQAEAR